MATNLQEKPFDVKVETVNLASPEPYNEVLREEQRRVTRKVDFRLIPILGALYSVSGIDRTNIANAREAGMAVDLEMLLGNRYSVALLVFFVTYIIFELPSNLVLRKIGAAKWLTFLAFAWGVSILGAGFAKKWTDIVVIRLLVGIFEAGFFPGSMYLLSCWYSRFQLQKRIASFYAINILMGAFGNLLAYGLKQMEGMGGLRGWRWIFIIEGLLTIVLAFVAVFIIVDFPDKVHQSRRPFLTPAEVQIVKDALDADRGEEGGELGRVNLRSIGKVLMSWQPYVHGLLFMSAAVGVYGIVFFIQVIIKGMGFKSSIVLLLCTPPYLAAIPYSLGVACLADRTRLRAPFIAFQSMTTLIGLLLVAYHKNNGVRYFGIFLGVAGCNGNISTILAWQQNNVRGQTSRAVTTALQVLFGGVGGIYASLVFQQKDAPNYLNGMWATMATQLFALVAVVVLTLFHLRANKKAERGEIVLEGLVGFRYTY